MSAGPFVVVGEMRNWRRVALAPDGDRLLVFDDCGLAEHFALGLTDVGLEQATVGELADGDAGLVRVLGAYDAAPPCSFEVELAVDFPQDDWRHVAFAYGLVSGGRMLWAFSVANPN